MKANGQIGSNVDPASVHQTFSVVETDEDEVVDGNVTPGEITDGKVVEHDVVPGTIHYGNVTNGTVTASGPLSLFVTATGYGTKPLPITTAA